jgi:hypothetical protein
VTTQRLFSVGCPESMRHGHRHRLKTCATGRRGILMQVDNLHLRAGYELSEGLPVLREPALPASEGRMPRALPASSERRAGCPTRMYGDGAWAALSHRDGQTQVDNLCYGAPRWTDTG